MDLKLLQKEQFKKQLKELVDNKIADKIPKASKPSPQNSSETITNEIINIEHDKEMPKERYISPEKDRNLLMI